MVAKPKLVKEAEKLEDSAVQIKASAAKTEISTVRIEGSADRTVFAAERTYAAWVRTGLVAIASGVGAKALLAGILPPSLILLTGGVLILFSAFCFSAAVWRNLYHADPPVPGAKRLHPALLIVVNGFLVLVAFAALIGIMFDWFVP